jgi:transcriptional regulator CtsR
MSILADKIEQFILQKLVEERERDLILRRNELADELDCAPSQISYVLNTRFSNDRGFMVESRRGSGGFVRIVRLIPKQKEPVPVPQGDYLPVPHITLNWLDHLLYQLMQQRALTNREGILLHHTFQALFEEVDEPQRLAVIRRILGKLNIR